MLENNELYGKTEDYNQYDKDTKVVDYNQYYDDDSLISLLVSQCKCLYTLLSMYTAKWKGL